MREVLRGIQKSLTVVDNECSPPQNSKKSGHTMIFVLTASI